MKKTLLITNDFPPKKGGIQTYLEGFAHQLDTSQLYVYTSSPKKENYQKYDIHNPWKTYRARTPIMLPTLTTRIEMQNIIRRHNIKNVWFGASVPLGILADSARAAGAQKILMSTHGHEIGWSSLPVARTFLRRTFAKADTITYLTEATLRALRPFIPNETTSVRLPGGIDTDAFAFHASERERLRNLYNIPLDAPVIVCISRLVERKGQDMLIKSMDRIHRDFPQAYLVIVGDGHYKKHLHKLAHLSSARSRIIFTGAVPQEELPHHYSMGDIFAMPCRTRGGDLDIEGLGIVYLEAYGAGLPVVAGNSGGAPEAVIDKKTGYITQGNQQRAVESTLLHLLHNPQESQNMGHHGYLWLSSAWKWNILAENLLHELN